MCGPERKGCNYEPQEKGSVPHTAWISICLPGIFLTYRIDDDFLIFCGENGNQTHKKKKKTI